MSTQSAVKVVTTHVLSEMKLKGEKISMLTSYDYSMARIVDQAGIDVILVGDSASNVMAGHETTLPITLDQMIYHAASVVRGVKRALVVVDMPFGSYQGNSKGCRRHQTRRRRRNSRIYPTYPVGRNSGYGPSWTYPPEHP